MQTRLLAIFAALFAVAALIAGCSGSSSENSGKDLPDPATLLKESSETTKGQTSAHLKLSVQGQIPELPVETLEGDLTQAPAVAAQRRLPREVPVRGQRGARDLPTLAVQRDDGWVRCPTAGQHEQPDEGGASHCAASV